MASVLAGYDTPEHVEQAAAYETAADGEKDCASVLAHAPRHTFGQGACAYCGHCRPCPVNIDIAMVNKHHDLASAARCARHGARPLRSAGAPRPRVRGLQELRKPLL